MAANMPNPTQSVAPSSGSRPGLPRLRSRTRPRSRRRRRPGRPPTPPPADGGRRGPARGRPRRSAPPALRRHLVTSSRRRAHDARRGGRVNGGPHRRAALPVASGAGANSAGAGRPADRSDAPSRTQAMPVGTAIAAQNQASFSGSMAEPSSPMPRPSGRAAASRRPAARERPSRRRRNTTTPVRIPPTSRHQEADQEASRARGRPRRRPRSARRPRCRCRGPWRHRAATPARRRPDPAGGRAERAAQRRQADDDQRRGQHREDPVRGGDREQGEGAGLDVVEVGQHQPTGSSAQRAPPTSPVVAARESRRRHGRSFRPRGRCRRRRCGGGSPGNQGTRSRAGRELSPGAAGSSVIPCPCSR